MTETTQTRTYQGRDLAALVHRASADAGPDAVVISRGEALRGGVGGFFQERCVELEVETAGAGQSFSLVLDEATAQLGPELEADMTPELPGDDVPALPAPAPAPMGADDLRPLLVERGVSWQLACELAEDADRVRPFMPGASQHTLVAEALARRIRVTLPDATGTLAIEGPDQRAVSACTDALGNAGVAAGGTTGEPHVALPGSLSLHAARAVLAGCERPAAVILVCDEIAGPPGGVLTAALELRLPLSLVVWPGASEPVRLAEAFELAALLLPEAA